MNRIHNITLDSGNKIGESKLNFFADYFLFVNDYIGLLDDIPLENHLSIVEKILAQIKDNLYDSIPYLDNYLSSPFLQDELAKEFLSYNELIQYIAEYQGFKEKRNIKIKWIKQNQDFILTLHRFKSELEEGLFRKALDAIKSLMSCPHGLSYHINEIKYYTNIMVSEYLFRGFSKKDIKTFLSSTFSKNKYDFIFPEAIKTPEEKSEYLQQVKLKKQLEAFWRAFNKEIHESNFIFRIKNITAEDDFSFIYNKVTFKSNQHEMFISLRKGVYDKLDLKIVDRFFRGQDKIVLAVISIQFSSFETALQQARNQINKELSYLNYTTGANAILDPFEYVTLSPEFTFAGGSVQLDKNSDDITIDNHKEKLEDNPYKYLDDVNSPAKDHLLKFENAFTQAISSKKPNDYWQYIENLIQSALPNNKKEVKSYVSSILLLNSFSYHQNQILRYTLNAITPFNSSAERIGIDIKRQLEIFQKWEQQSLKSLSEEVNNDFINHIIDNYTNALEWLPLGNDYYKSILKEAYEQRNFYVHQGSEHPKAVTKLQITLPRLVARLRWLLLEEIRNHPKLDFKQILDSLKEKGEKN
ncbi:hypothetical protein [Catalinimonas niigatensis]|uniref:hypothetical protein n=1 Tax=Catalinimonas niigatensis TaxID=1397264 RepID=UPI002666B752|nr:hypothetical protein [Catalinimonas niigatensis]WPP52282.1 hypothetical protein PZB72_07805 [Catalinimonas niigatensis]